MIHYLDYGTAVRAYVTQTLGAAELDVDYVVEQKKGNICVLHWDRSEPEPTEEQLVAALNVWDWGNVRKRRNELLDATDWCAHVDSPAMSDEMKTYRQALRDLPASCENSADVVWPEKP